MNRTILRARDRHADIARRVRVAAGGEDPVAEAGAQQDAGGDGGEPEPPEDRDRDALHHAAGRRALVRCRPRSASQANRRACRPGRRRAAPASRARPELVDAGDLRAAGDDAGQADRQAAQDEQAAERDDEGRQAGA